MGTPQVIYELSRAYGTLLREILYNINFNRVLSASLVNLLHGINRVI